MAYKYSLYKIKIMGKSRAKVKTMKVTSTSGEDVATLQKLFSQITGTANADREVIIPKIISIYNNIINYNKLYKILLNLTPLREKFTEYSFWFDEITEFLDNLIKSTNTDITKSYNTDGSFKFHDLNDDELNVFYKELKENEYIKKMIITSSTLNAYKKSLSKDTVDYSFIQREPGIVLQPLAFSSLDLKLIWSTELTKKEETVIFNILSRTFNMGIDLYEIITSPDVDIKNFSKTLVDSISKMKKQIPRCDKAFGIIERSVSMLESNFKSYFRNSVEAGNPSIIIESFIVDISTTQKTNVSVTSEFRRIISFLRENSMNTNDPRIKKLFELLNNQFSSIDTELGFKIDEPTSST